MSTQSPAITYNSLRQEITTILDTGKMRVQRTLEDQLLSTYHAVGQRIHAHLETGGHRAEYGTQLVKSLSNDVGMGVRQLYDCLRFYRQYSQVPTSEKLGWSHYRLALALPTPDERKRVLDTAAREKWTVRELHAQIQSRSEPKPDTPNTPRDHLPPLRGRLYTYKVQNGRLDLGFRIYRTFPNLPEAPTVRAIQNENGYRFEPAEGRRDTFYTYHATLRRIIDGDTLWLGIDCGFDTWTDQKLRLRSIDTPELNTPEGQRARRFAEAALHNATLVITTTRPDKYGRYLTDIFYLPGTADPETVLETGNFLNRELLEAKLAKKF